MRGILFFALTLCLAAAIASIACSKGSECLRQSDCPASQACISGGCIAPTEAGIAEAGSDASIDVHDASHDAIDAASVEAGDANADGEAGAEDGAANPEAGDANADAATD